MDINYIFKLLMIFIFSALTTGLGIVLLKKNDKNFQLKCSLYDFLYDLLSVAFDLFIMFSIIILILLIEALLFKN